MGNPKYSIVIPTRNRATTLIHAIETCLRQTLADFEVIVFDNSSRDPAADYCSSIADPRVKFFRSETPLAMTDSWERAISHATGEYITIIGDDDGLLGFTLETVDQVLRIHDTSAIRWDWVSYRWPDSMPADEANQLRIGPNRPSEVIESRSVIQRVSQQECWYGKLPMIYNSFVHRIVLDEIRKSAGRVFYATSPDVYSGFAIGHRVGRYVSLGFPLAIAGTGASSNGAACIRGEKGNAIAKDFTQLNSAAGISWHPLIPRVNKSISAVTAEAFEWARERHFATAYVPPTDLPRLTTAIVSDLRFRAKLPPDELQEVLSVIRCSLRDHPQTQQWLDRFCLTTSLGCAPTGWAPGLHDDAFYLDASRFAVSSVADAAKLIESLLGRPPISALSFSDSESGNAAGKPARSGDAASRLKRIARDLVPPLVWRLARSFVPSRPPA